jgi:hypothetical protein
MSNPASRWEKFYPSRSIASLGSASLVVGLVGLTLLLATVERVPVVWFDESLVASIAHSLATDGSGVPPVLAPYSDVLPLHLVYGPAFFTLGAWALKLSGFSVLSLRVVSYAGACLLVASASALVRALTASRTAAYVCFALLALSPEVGWRATSGRMDTLAVGLELAGFAALVVALGPGPRRRAAGLCALAGVCWAGAVLTTPRTFPFFAAVALVGPAFLLLARARRRLAVALVWAGAIASALVTAWTLSEGLNPLSWLHVVYANTSASATTTLSGPNEGWVVSFPIFGGGTPLAALVLLAAAVISACFAAVSRRDYRSPEGELRGFAFLVLLVSSLVSLALASTPQHYGIYWALPLLPAALALCWPSLSPDAPAASRRCVAVSLACLAVLYVGIRCVKTAQALDTWRARDATLVESFVASQIPSGSLVYGPAEYYYYAVERSGSVYRYAPGLPYVGEIPGVVLGTRARRDPVLEPLVRRADEQYRPRTYAGVYLIWPDRFRPPGALDGYTLVPLASLTPPPSYLSSFGVNLPASVVYPPTTIYRLDGEGAPQP